MLSAAWRPAAKIAVNKSDEVPMTRLRHATAWPMDRFVALGR